jgi:hypothetical protein
MNDRPSAGFQENRYGTPVSVDSVVKSFLASLNYLPAFSGSILERSAAMARGSCCPAAASSV